VADGCTHIYVGGGDGTLNEVLNGVASVGGALRETTIGLIPLGTGNDFAAALGLPADVDAALGVLELERRFAVDLGLLNERVFVNVSGGGFLAEVSESVTPELKSIAGRLAYLLGGAQALMEFEPVGLRLEAADTRLDTRCHAFAVCNSRLVGGGRPIAPHALIDDGLLDVCVIEAMSTVEFVKLLRQVRDGSHVEDGRVHYLQAPALSLTFDREIGVNTDGEVLTARTCGYRVLPAAATFFAGEPRFASASGSKA
jgi:diacylglycerol kinase (ATP)